MMKFFLQKNGFVKTNLTADEFEANCEYDGWCPYLASVLLVKDGFLYERDYDFSDEVEEGEEPPSKDFLLKISSSEFKNALSQTLKRRGFFKDNYCFSV